MRTKDPTELGPGKHTRRSPKHDPQQHKLYRLERTIVGMALHTSTDANYLQQLSATLCGLYHVHPPRIRRSAKQFEGDHIFARYIWEDQTIWLNPAFHGSNLSVMLHELAHHIADNLHGPEEEAHGPKFCAIYMYLQSKARLLPMYVFRVMAAKHDVEIASEWRPSAVYRRRKNANV